MKAAEIKQALENASGFQWTEPDPATDPSGYCDRHRPAAEKKSPANGNSPTDSSGYCEKHKPKTEKKHCDKHGPTCEQTELVGFGPSPQNFDDIIAKTAASVKQNPRAMQFKIGKVRLYASENEDGVFVPGEIEVDFKDLCLAPKLDEKVQNKVIKDKASPANKNGSNKSASNEKGRKKDDKDGGSLEAASSFLASAVKDINWAELHGNKGNAKTKKTKEKNETKTEKSGKENKPKEKLGKENKQEDTVDDKATLRQCGRCGKEEPRRKAFKKCQK